MLNKLETMTEVPQNILETQLSDMTSRAQYVILVENYGEHDFDLRGFQNFKTFSLDEFDVLYQNEKVYNAIADAYKIYTVHTFMKLLEDKSYDVLEAILYY